MSTRVLFNLLNELGKRGKLLGLPSILSLFRNEFNTFDNTRARTLDSIRNKSENATLQLSIFYEKVLDKKYLLKLNNVAQTSSKRFVATPPNCLV